jgi:hypothetical protein
MVDFDADGHQALGDGLDLAWVVPLGKWSRQRLQREDEGSLR